jgi:primary-amine oxidase
MTIALLISVLGTLLTSHVFAQALPQHPLDPLTAPEYVAAIRALHQAGHLNEDEETDRYPLIILEEPSKKIVLDWQATDPIPRRALVVVKKGRQTFEAIVDLTDSAKPVVVSWHAIEGVEPGVLLTEEWLTAQEIVRAHPDWQAAMRKRGIEDFQDIVCIPNTVGYHGLEEEDGKRLVKVSSYDGRGTQNFWARPITGVLAVIDHHAKQVIAVTDTGLVPIPQAPIAVTPPAQHTNHTPDPNIQITGHMIRWRPWQFHLRVDPRLGPVISLVRYHDTHSKQNGHNEPKTTHGRLILYQGSLSELFVPYMDPSPEWYFRTYMDAGEYGVGKLAAALKPGIDCPVNAAFFHSVFANEWGTPYP